MILHANRERDFHLVVIGVDDVAAVARPIGHVLHGIAVGIRSFDQVIDLTGNALIIQLDGDPIPAVRDPVQIVRIDLHLEESVLPEGDHGVRFLRLPDPQAVIKILSDLHSRSAVRLELTEDLEIIRLAGIEILVQPVAEFHFIPVSIVQPLERGVVQIHAFARIAVEDIFAGFLRREGEPVSAGFVLVLKLRGEFFVKREFHSAPARIRANGEDKIHRVFIPVTDGHAVLREFLETFDHKRGRVRAFDGSGP